MAILIAIAFIVATVVLSALVFVVLMWWVLVWQLIKAPQFTIPLAGLIVVVFLLPQVMFSGTWLAEKAHNGALRLNDALWYIVMLPFHIPDLVSSVYHWFV